MKSERGPGQRAGLTRAGVIAAARALLEEQGADAVTMRALAKTLGVAPNALYSYVESRTQLLDEILDDLLGSIAEPRSDSDQPVDEIAALMKRTYTLLTSHPNLVPVFLARQGARGPNAVGLGAGMDELLRAAGLRGKRIADARRVLIIHTIGSAAFATAGPVSAEGARPMSPDASYRSFTQSLQWLLAGITQH